MLDFIKKNEKRILFAAIAIYIILWIFIFEEDTPWTGVFLPLFIAISLFVYELVASKTDKEKRNYFDLKEFKANKPFTIDSLCEVFKDEQNGSGFTLPVILSCEMRGGSEEAAKSQAKPLTAPLTGTDCVAYRITCGCVKPRDIAARNQSKRVRKRRAISGYSQYLFSFQEQLRLSLHEGESSAWVSDTGIFNFARITEKHVAWSNLSELTPALRERIQNEIGLQKLNKKDYTGIVIEEQVLVDKEQCTVYGVCKKSNGMLLITGTGVQDDPGCLYITTLQDKERRRTVKGYSHSLLFRRLIVYPGIALVFAFAAYPSVIDYYQKKGHVRYEAPLSMQKLEIKRSTKEGVDRQQWYFDPGTDGSFTRLKDAASRDILITADSTITISNIVEQKADYAAGKDSAIGWEGSYWRLILKDELPRKSGSKYYSGKIYIKNSTDKQFVIRFDQAAGSAFETYTWEWTPRLGVDSENGTYAFVYQKDAKGRMTGEKEVILATGDALELSYANKTVGRYFLGYSQEVKFVPGTGWAFVITNLETASRTSRLYVRNDSSKDYAIEILNPAWKKKYDTWWDFIPGDVEADDQGVYLAFESDDAAIEPGDIVRVTQKNTSPVFEGAISSYEHAAYDFLYREWTITAAKKPALK